MAVLYAPQTNFAMSSTDTSTSTRLMGYKLTFWRGLWGVVALVSLILFVYAVPIYYDTLRSVPLMETPKFLDPVQLYAEDMLALREFGLSTDVYAGYLSTLWIIHGVICYSIGVVIFWRKSDDWMVIFTSLILVLISGISSTSPTSILPIVDEATWYLPYHFMLGMIAVSLLAMFFTFPDGQFVPRWSPLVVLVCGAWFQMSTLFPGSSLDLATWHPLAFLAFLLIFFGSAFYSQVYRFQHIASPSQRQQTKWAVWGFSGIVILGVMFPTFARLLFPAIAEPGLSHAVYNLVAQTLLTLCSSLLGISVGISVLRYRLWEIDIVINRSLVYGALTVVLGLVFFVSVFVIQQIFQVVTNGMQSPIALALSTLVIGGLFQPARRQMRHFIDRRFYGLVIDLDQFNGQVRPITNPGALSGITLGGYKLLEPIGHGGMGEVYKGHQATLDRTVAVKILSKHLATQEEFRIRLEREAKTVASLKHPNIVNVFDFGQMDDLNYMVMEFIEGEELGDLLKAEDKLPLEMVLPIVQDIASALDYAHVNGLVHRDIKPSNVMLRMAANRDSGIQAILMDFGIAKILNAHTRLTGTGLVGTLDYVAPEQIVSSREVDHRVDIYALGIMTYQMLTGMLPFASSSVSQVLFGHLNRPAPDARDVLPDLPDPVAQAIQKALAKRADDRFQSAGEFAAALQGIVALGEF